MKESTHMLFIHVATLQTSVLGTPNCAEAVSWMSVELLRKSLYIPMLKTRLNSALHSYAHSTAMLATLERAALACHIVRVGHAA